jgi:tetratricopeptide (TPR) repeat protein
MSVLIAQLARPRRTMHWRGLAAAISLATVVALTAVAAARRSELCGGAELALAGVWDETRADAVSGALVATQVAYGQSTATRVRADLDEYAAAWAHAYTDACEATQVRGEQPPEVMDARMRCLEGARRQLRAVVDVLAEADDATLVHAMQTVGGLPRLARCDDPEVLASQVPPPEPSDGPEVDAIREGLAEAHALELAGRYADGLHACAALLPRAEALGYVPVLAEVAFRKGWLEERAGDPTTAEASLETAFFAAREAGMDELAANAASALVVVVGMHLARHDDGQAWAERARAHAEWLADDTVKAGICSNLGSFSYARGEYDEALELHRCALELKREVLGVESPDVATTLHNLGNVQAARGEHDEALAHHLRALEIVEQAFGPDHPEVGELQNSLGGLQYAQGRFDEAADHFSRALAIWEPSLGAEHPDVATVLSNLGAAENERGHHARSIDHQKRALAIRERVFGPDHPDVGTSLNNLGAVLRAQGSLDESLAQFERALAIWERALGSEHPDVALVHGNIAKIHLQRGAHVQALVHARRALAINEAALGTDHRDLAYPLTTIGQALVLAARPNDAISELERALALRSREHVDPVLVAETRFALARALRDAGRDRPRAQELAEAALSTYRTAGERTAEQTREVEAWLERRRYRSVQ